MDRLDLHLAFVLAYCAAMALHLGLAFAILQRYGGQTVVEVRIFSGANIALAAWHGMQLVDFLRLAGLLVVPDTINSLLTAVQLFVGLLVLVLFFHLFCTFERVYRRRAPSLRAAISNVAHRQYRILVPAAYLLLLVGAIAFLVDTEGAASAMRSLRSMIGPTSAYLFGGTLLFMTFVLFPARPGQDKIMVPALGRAGLMLSLGACLVMIAAWNDAHPTRTALALMPYLHLHSVAFCIFLALVRYEFSFMDRFVSESLRFGTWMLVVLGCYYVFNRVEFVEPRMGRVATSATRIAVLLVAVGLGPALGHAVARWSDRVLFGRHQNLEGAVHRFSARLAKSRNLGQLVDGAADDIAQAIRARKVHIVLSSTPERREQLEESARADGDPYRVRVPLGSGKSPPGWILLGERRNLYPYFDGERRYLQWVADLLGGSVRAIRGMGTSTASVVTEDSAGGELEHANRRIRELERQVADARSAEAALRERLDPDLVMDVLNLADELASRNVESALAILGRLRAVYDYVVALDDNVSTLHDEMDFARNYLALERLRLRNRLDVEITADQNLAQQMVPRRMLQPLIENALQHGIARELRMGSVRILAHEQKGVCQIRIEDNGRGFPPSFELARARDGGLVRVRQWLQKHYGEKSTLTVDPGFETGARVVLQFPRRDLDRRRFAQPA